MIPCAQFPYSALKFEGICLIILGAKERELLKFNRLFPNFKFNFFFIQNYEIL